VPRKGKDTLVAAALGLALAAGGLFTTGALDPVVNDAVALVRAKVHAGDPAALNASKVTDWMYYDDVPEWSSVRGVPQVARPTQPDTPVTPAIAPPEHPHRVLFAGPPPMPTISLKPRDDCMEPHNPVSIAHNFVVTATGGGQAAVRWWDIGDPDTQQYEVVAVPEYVNHFNYSTPVPDPPKTFTSVTPAKGCQQLRTTVTGLTVGAQYTFALMAINKSPLSTVGRTYSITRATSERITIK
jgi:hypothetical protein